MPQHLLQLADLLRERRLRNVQPHGCAPEMELFSDSNKIAQVAKLEIGIHILIISISLNKILDVWLIPA